MLDRTEPGSPPAETLADNTTSSESAPGAHHNSLAPEDFYFEGPFLVFTAAFHLKRGFCCNSGCRHCPYR